MKRSDPTGADLNLVDLATFRIGRAFCGIDILEVLEIQRSGRLTPVPGAPEYVRGILNLRGHIVTVIDPGQKAGLSGEPPNGHQTFCIIVPTENEYIGLQVDGICGVVRARRDRIERPPANLGGLQGRYLRGVIQTEGSLVGFLDVAALVREAS